MPDPPAEPRSGIAVWSSPEWREEAVAWLDARLAAGGRERTGPVEQPHLRAWATLLRAETPTGAVWLKAAAPGTAAEAGIYGLLHEIAADRVLDPIAVDPDRGWMLLPDGGTPLARRVEGAELVDELVTAFPLYAELQRAVTPHVDRLLALGLDDMRAAAMPARFEQALAITRPFAEAAEDVDRRTYQRIEGMAATVAEWCGRLAAAPVPASIDHNDIHASNILGGGGEPVRFFDWGDSVVGHPFASMLVGLGFVQNEVLPGAATDDPRILRLRDAYLEPFTDTTPRPELIETLELACRVAKIARALAWQRAVELATDDRWARAPFETLASLLDESYLGVD
jgi:hypothetical protein